MNQVSLTPEQVQQAAAAGANLLSDDDRVSIPPSLARNGQFNVLIGVLNALASGQVVLGSPPKPEEPKADGDNGGEPPAED